MRPNTMKQMWREGKPTFGIWLQACNPFIAEVMSCLGFDWVLVDGEHSPVDMLYLTENTSTTLISPAQYRRYCLPQVRAYGEVVASYGRLLALHMCGHLKLLLPTLAELPAQAFEAFTSPPVGNTRLAEGRAACPSKCLIGGTNAVLWTKTADEMIAEIERDLDALPHHRGIAVTSAGVMPPLCPPETIRAVCEWVKTYPVRM